MMKKAVIALTALLLVCSAVSAQQKLKVVVAAAGAEPAQKRNTLKIIETKVQEAFVNDGRYTAITRDSAERKLIDKELKYQYDGAVDDRQIAKLGKVSGAKYICMVRSNQSLESFMLEARLVDIETNDIIAMGSTKCDLVSISDLTAASVELVRQLISPNSPSVYGRGFYWDKRFAVSANPMSDELAKILSKKVSVSEGTCVSGMKIALESEAEPTCTEGMVGITCKVNTALTVTQCQGDQKTVLRGTVTGVDKSSKDAALKQVMRKAESADFWSAWVKELETRGKK